MSEPTDADLDSIYEFIDYMLRMGQFDAVDGLLSNLYVPNLHVDLILGFLTVTFAAKAHLPSRVNFLEDCEVLLKRSHPHVFLDSYK